MSQDEEEKGFTVKDRRRFDASGNRREEARDERDSGSRADRAPPPPQAQRPQQPPPQAQRPQQPPPQRPPQARPPQMEDDDGEEMTGMPGEGEAGPLGF